MKYLIFVAASCHVSLAARMKRHSIVDLAAVSSTSPVCGVHQKSKDCKRARGCMWNIMMGGKETCTAKWAIWDSPGPKFSDIVQGELGSCYFLAVLSSIANSHLELIENMFKHRGLWKRGKSSKPVYITEWLVDGAPTRVAVDEMLPVKNDLPAFAKFYGAFAEHRHNGVHAVWPAILEKAWAKFFGNYKRIENGYGVESFKGLTQAPVDLLPHGNAVNSAWTFVHPLPTKDDLWMQIKSALHNGFPMVAETGENTTNGIAPGHVYALIGADIKRIGHGVGLRRVVRLHNPWSWTQYVGDVPNGTNTRYDDGDFWMTLEEFVSAFAMTDIARVRRDYKMSATRITKSSQRVAFTFEFEIKRDDTFAIQLEWPSARILPDCHMELDPMVYLEVSDGNTTFGTSRTELQRWARQSSVRVDLPGGAGNYTVSFYADFPHAPWLRKVVLNAYARETVTFKKKKANRWPSSLEFRSFHAVDLNTKYVENVSKMVDGLATYWALDGNYFVYWNSRDSRWALSPGTDFSNVQHGEDSALDNAMAWAPREVDIRDPSAHHSWEEWDVSLGKSLPPAGHVRLTEFKTCTCPREVISLEQRKCEIFVKRKEEVNNWIQVRYGEDSLFPPALDSVSSSDESLGDAAQDIANKASSYTQWKPITEIMANLPI